MTKIKPERKPRAQESKVKNLEMILPSKRQIGTNKYMVFPFPGVTNTVSLRPEPTN